MNIDDRLQDEESDDIYEGPSKSQKKREAEALQKLGGELAKLAPDAFERVTGLPEDIRDAILEYRRLKSFGALRRQMQLIGKLMRRLDYDAVREAIDRATGASRAAAAAHPDAAGDGVALQRALRGERHARGVAGEGGLRERGRARRTRACM